MTTATDRDPRSPALSMEVAVLLLVEAAALATAARLARSPTYRVTWSDLHTWLATSAPTDVAVALLLPVAATLAGYLLAVTVLYLLALLARVPWAVALLAPVTPCRIRGLLERTVAVGLLAATWTPPAVAHPVGAGGPIPPGLHPPPAATAGEVVGPELRLPGIPLPEVAPPRDVTPEVRTVTVVAGDHLWAISARALADARGIPVAELPSDELARYWAAVVRANEGRLRSGDADLIHPGETVRLPDPPATRRPDGA